ncbi:MAG: GSCFA domain-containing protein [Chitinophagales bacterium]|nr:GSCFA domain-containing protein [Bacteroidota bacterium]MCB9043519.1 GSCFA domain-containing protein [Chitinophagales bacterium]
MSDFRTKITPSHEGLSISVNAPILLAGSCFAENIGALLRQHHFETLQNPSGIVFNPVSIAHLLQQACRNKQFSEQDVLFFEGQYLSLAHHSELSRNNLAEMQSVLTQKTEQTRQFLQKAQLLILSLGTSIVYKHVATETIVANCHKLPARDFETFRLSPEQISDSLANAFADCWEINPSLKILLTVSPIRHWRSGYHQNQLSKAALLLAVDALQKRFGQQCFYFPAYELLLDDLRDYRFYAADMLHPSAEAVQYIWQHFVNTYFDERAKNLVNLMEKINRAKTHRPRQQNSAAYMSFLQAQLLQVHEAALHFPEIDFSPSKSYFLEEINRVGEKLT